MSQEIRTNEPLTIDPSMQFPITMSIPEIQGVLVGLRKFPMEQVERLVLKIEGQLEAIIKQTQQVNNVN